MTQKPPKWKRFVFALILILSSLSFTLVSAEWFLRHRRHSIENSGRRDAGLIEYDPILGWKLSKNWKGRHRHHDFDVQYTTNTYGFRGTFEKKQTASGSIYAVVGDSFTFSYGVNDGETFIDRLNRINIAEGTTFYNFGVPGYSTDQEFLLIRERVFAFAADVILLVVYLHNDLIDNIYPFPLQADHGKPYFAMTSTGLTLKNTPVPKKTKDPEQRRIDVSSVILGGALPAQGILARNANRFEVTRRVLPFFQKPPDFNEQFENRLRRPLQLFFMIIEQIRRECRRRSVDLKIVLMPGKSYVERPESISAHYQNYLRKRILKEYDATDQALIDLAGYLRGHHERRKTRLFHPNEGHLNVAGHRAVADFLSARLKTP